MKEITVVLERAEAAYEVVAGVAVGGPAEEEVGDLDRVAPRAHRGWVVEAMPRLPDADHGGLGAAQAQRRGKGGPAAGGARREPAVPQLAEAGPGDPLAPAGRGLRHRFEHYEIVHDDQVARTVELGLVASSQPNFVGEWSAKGGMYHARLGDRYRLNNRFRSFLDAGVALAFGSDGMPFGPLVGLQGAVGHPDPGQRLTPAEAVWHYTTGAAWALHWEDAVGALVPGMKADLVVLEQTELDAQPAKWVVKETIAGGVRRA